MQLGNANLYAVYGDSEVLCRQLFEHAEQVIEGFRREAFTNHERWMQDMQATFDSMYDKFCRDNNTAFMVSSPYFYGRDYPVRGFVVEYNWVHDCYIVRLNNEAPIVNIKLP